MRICGSQAAAITANSRQKVSYPLKPERLEGRLACRAFSSPFLSALRSVRKIRYIPARNSAALKT